MENGATCFILHSAFCILEAYVSLITDFAGIQA
jgi:hypothetical protein